MKLLVTGGAGFIGSCFVRTALKEKWAAQVVNLDKLTYAGKLDNLEPVADHPGYSFIQADIAMPQRSKKCLPPNLPTLLFTLQRNRMLTAAFTRLLQSSKLTSTARSLCLKQLSVRR